MQRARILREKGGNDGLIVGLLQDAQCWTDFCILLQKHVHTAKYFLKVLEENEFLCDEAKDEESAGHVHGKPEKQRKARKQPLTKPNQPPKIRELTILFKDIEELKNCERRINSLDKETKELIQLVSIFVNLYQSWPRTWDSIDLLHGADWSLYRSLT